MRLSRFLPVAPLAALAGCGEFAATELLEGALELPAGTTAVRIVVPVGSVTVHAGTRPGLAQYRVTVRRVAEDAAGLEKLEAVPMGPVLESRGTTAEITFAAIPDELVTRHSQAAIKAMMWLPADLPLEVETRAGHLSAMRRETRTVLRTGRGDVRLQGCAGASEVRIGSAKVGPEGGRGNVLVDNHRGGLDVSTSRGRIIAYLREIAPPGVRLVTGVGAIQCSVPRGVGLDLEGTTEFGKLKNSFDVPVERSGTTATMKGRVLGGGPPVFISTREGAASVAGIDYARK